MSGTPPAVSLEPGHRVLVTRLDYLGDIILSLALVDALHERWPGIEIDYLARRPGSDVLRDDDRFGRVFAIDAKPGIIATTRLVRELRRRRYRAVVDLYSNPRSAWLSWLSGAPVRIGSDRRGRRHLYTHPVRVPVFVRSALRHHLEQARPLGVDAVVERKPVVTPGNAARERARLLLSNAGIGEGTRCVGIHPGGKWDVKRWPAESFASLARLLFEKLHTTVVVLTGPGEEAHSAAVAARAGDAVRVLGAMNVGDVAAVIASLDAMVACDGGIMHLSVAVGTPTVGVFGSAEPAVWFPYKKMGPYRVSVKPLDCRPCHEHVCPLGHTDCLTGLAPETVFEQVAALVTMRSRPGTTEGST